MSANGRFVVLTISAPTGPHLEATLGTDAVTRLGDETLHRPRVEYRDGFAPRTYASTELEHGARRRNTLLVVNDTDAAVPGSARVQRERPTAPATTG